MLETGKKYVNHSYKLEEKEGFTDLGIQKTSKETRCSLTADGE